MGSTGHRNARINEAKLKKLAEFARPARVILLNHTLLLDTGGSGRVREGSPGGSGRALREKVERGYPGRLWGSSGGSCGGSVCRTFIRILCFFTFFVIFVFFCDRRLIGML